MHRDEVQAHLRRQGLISRGVGAAVGIAHHSGRTDFVRNFVAIATSDGAAPHAVPCRIALLRLASASVRINSQNASAHFDAEASRQVTAGLAVAFHTLNVKPRQGRRAYILIVQAFP